MTKNSDFRTTMLRRASLSWRMKGETASERSERVVEGFGGAVQSAVAGCGAVAGSATGPTASERAQRVSERVFLIQLFARG